MGAFPQLINQEQEFRTSATTSAIIINDLDDTSEEQKAQINRTIFTVQGDIFTNIPSCECGELTGAYNQGVKCDVCNTEVTKKLESNLDSLVWIRSPADVAPFINIKVWYMLNEAFTKSNFSVLQYLTDPSYTPNQKALDWQTKIVEDLHTFNITGRGWNYFVNNFDYIMDTLFQLASVRKTGKKIQDYLPLQELLKKERDILFTHYIPMPNRSLLVIEDNESGKWREASIDGVINAMRLMMGIDVGIQKYSQRTKESRVVKVMNYLADFHADFEKANAKKEGIWRKHVMGTRVHFGTRAVISSLTDEHEYDELHFPWGAAVSLLRYHLMNKLEKRGFTVIKAINFLNKFALEYHPLLDDMFKELIMESPYKGIPVVHIRNPVLKVGSTELLYITKVKTDTDDNTVGTSILSVVPWNLDFDGDQMSSTMTLDNKTTRQFQLLEPHVNGFSMERPFEVSDNLWLPKPLIATISNWMHDDKQPQATPEQVSRMQALFS